MRHCVSFLFGAVRSTIIGTALLGLLALSSGAQAQGSPSDYTSATRYDIKGQVTGTIAPDPDGTGNLTYLATRTTYDVRGNVVKVENGKLVSWQPEAIAPEDWTGFTAHVTVHAAYDNMNRKLKSWTIGSDGVTENMTQMSYDDLGRVTCTAIRMNKAQFTSLPADACTHDSEGSFGKDRITRNIYEVTGRIAQVRRAAGTPLEQAEITYSYTANGKQKYIIDANGNRAEMVYDGHDRLKQWRFPSPVGASAYDDSTQASALDSSGIANPGDMEEYGYDLNGNRTSLTKRDGQVIDYTYDALNRMTAKDLPGSAADVSYSFDNRGLQTAALFSASSTGITTSYDNAGRVLSSANDMSGTALTLSYQYDKNSNRTKITHPDGEEFDYTYDGLNRQLGINENTSSTTLHSSTYNNQGQMITATRLTGVESSYGYDPAGRVNSIALALAGTAHDNAFTFTYTPASQISIRTTSNDLYAHKAHHNVERSYTVNGLNQYTAVGDYTVTHDPNGNLTSDGAVSFTYDTENRLVSASGAKSAGLVYDPLGRLYETNDGAGGGVTRFLYDGDALVAEYDGSGNITARYVHGNGVDNPLVWYDGSTVGSTNRRHLFANWQGSISLITGATGGMIQVNAYDAHGIPNPDNLGRFGFTGQIHIPELGLNYFKARMHSPYIDRFLQTDPIGYDDGFHLYRYAGNDPVNFVDPTGMYICQGSAEDCGSFSKSLQRAGDAANSGDLSKEERKSLRDAVGSYGKAGVNNGVVVNLRKNSDEIAKLSGTGGADGFAQFVPEGTTTSKGKLDRDYVVVFLPKNFESMYSHLDDPDSRNALPKPARGGRFSGADERANVVAHEGDHVFMQMSLRRNLRGREAHPRAHCVGNSVNKAYGSVSARDHRCPK